MTLFASVSVADPAVLPPVDKLHQEKIQSIRAAEIEDGDDAGMVQFSQRPGLARKTLGEGVLAADAGRQNFQRNHAIELFLARLIDGPHTAPADKVQQFELGEERRQL